MPKEEWMRCGRPKETRPKCGLPWSWEAFIQELCFHVIMTMQWAKFSKVHGSLSNTRTSIPFGSSYGSSFWNNNWKQWNRPSYLTGTDGWYQVGLFPWDLHLHHGDRIPLHRLSNLLWRKPLQTHARKLDWIVSPISGVQRPQFMMKMIRQVMYFGLLLTSGCTSGCPKVTSNVNHSVIIWYLSIV